MDQPQLCFKRSVIGRVRSATKPDIEPPLRLGESILQSIWSTTPLGWPIRQLLMSDRQAHTTERIYAVPLRDIPYFADCDYGMIAPWKDFSCRPYEKNLRSIAIGFLLSSLIDCTWMVFQSKSVLNV
ncbi:unnamed protein product [Haemonchus placei]|uniref:Uncharacterized protein n=1 Tax=Haemonchus placei TaxID=6290 RepID=A0A0N4W8S3_HAEPC|nr:unnamed protein product [Haemonchus placei]